MSHPSNPRRPNASRQGNRVLTRRRCMRMAIATWMIRRDLVDATAADVKRDAAAASPPSRDVHDEALRTIAHRVWQRLPKTFSGDRDWDATREVFDGWRWQRVDGSLPRPVRRTKSVPHGRWYRYDVRLDEQLARRFDAESESLRIRVPDPVATDVQTVELRSDLAGLFRVRSQNHRRGVKLSSVTAEGRFAVEVRLDVDVRVRGDYREIPPAIVVDPRVRQASITLESFELERVSHVGGDLAEAWGEVLQETLVRPLVKRFSDDLASRLNREIDRHRDELRYSVRDQLTAALGGSEAVPER